MTFLTTENSGRISKWAMELPEYNAIKAQVLANFVAEWTEPRFAIEGGVPETLWVVYCDRVWEATGVGAVAVLLSPSGIKLRYTARMQFNNESDKCTNT
jgi:hypothetical protein